MSKHPRISKHIKARIWDLVLFLSSFSIPFVSMHVGLCGGACSGCWLCVALIPLMLMMAVLTQMKEKLLSLFGRMRKTS